MDRSFTHRRAFEGKKPMRFWCDLDMTTFKSHFWVVRRSSERDREGKKKTSKENNVVIDSKTKKKNFHWWPAPKLAKRIKKWKKKINWKDGNWREQKKRDWIWWWGFLCGENSVVRGVVDSRRLFPSMFVPTRRPLFVIPGTTAVVDDYGNIGSAIRIWCW